MRSDSSADILSVVKEKHDYALLKGKYDAAVFEIISSQLTECIRDLKDFLSEKEKVSGNYAAEGTTKCLVVSFKDISESIQNKLRHVSVVAEILCLKEWAHAK